MAPEIIYLPDGQHFTVKPVFSGLFFKSNEFSTQPNAYPIGWTVVLNTTKRELPNHHHFHDSHLQSNGDTTNGVTDGQGQNNHHQTNGVRVRTHAFVEPTLQDDNLFISSISVPSSTEYKAPASPSRQVAMMLWITLYWYFHQREPLPYLHTEASKDTPDDAKPRGDWIINIKKDGVLRGRNLIPKLERMGLIASADTSVSDESNESWARMFVSKKMFWQIPGRLFLFSLQHAAPQSASIPGSPPCSRPATPLSPSGPPHAGDTPDYSAMFSVPTKTITGPPSMVPSNPFYSNSHLPTYYPPGPLTYTITNNVRHPMRPKPPRMGEIFYARYVPSMGHYLSFRVASTSATPVRYRGPLGPNSIEHTHLRELSDTALLQSWLAKPRVSKFWGQWTPDFLTNAVASQHSFPVIGMWDGVPFGYFEIYWAKEDLLGQKLGDLISDWDRGLHILVGEEWARGRVPTWLTSLVQWSLMADYRTMSICLEPRIDNERFVLFFPPSFYLQAPSTHDFQVEAAANGM